MNRKTLFIAVIVVVIVVLSGISVLFLNGTSHPKTNLSTVYITTVSPVPTIVKNQLEVITNDMNAIGIPASYKAVGIPVIFGWLSGNTTPNMVVNPGFVPSWPDPVFNQVIGETDVAYGFTYVDDSWLNNSSLQSYFPNIMFDKNITEQQKQVGSIYQIIYNNAPYVWLPTPNNVFFKQPYVNGFAYNPSNVYYYNLMSYNASYTKILPPSNSTLTDAIQINAPDSLDPGSAGLLEDSTFLNSVYQGLLEPSPSNSTNVQLVLAKNYSQQNYQNFTFNMRSNLQFSNNDSINASDVWFSMYRSIVMGQPADSGANNFVLINSTQYGNTSYSLPWGFQNALLKYSNLTHYSQTSNDTLNAQNAANYLSNMLSNFNPANKTQMDLMTYGNQAVSINSTNPLNLQINLLKSYPFFAQSLAAATSNYIVDPSFIDSHGGVQPNTANNYTNLNGAIGSGPYQFKTISSSLSTITLEKNPNYWGTGVSNLPSVAEPANIKYIVVEYTLTSADKVSGFLSNNVQLTQIDPSSYASITNSSTYSALTISSYFVNEGASEAVWSISMNAQKYPTNLTDFRLAVEHAINYQTLDQLFNYNGKTLATNFLGPITPNFKGYYNPNNLPMYSFNITLAEHYLNLAGQQGHFYVTLSNGTVLGDKSMIKASPLSQQAVITAHSLEEQMVMAVTTKFI